MIKFYNINSGETRLAETEPMIAAFFNSSDLGPNASRGQDFGWRLAPETIIEMERIQSDQRTLETISAKYGILLDHIDSKDILRYISDKNDDSVSGQKQSADDFKESYEDEIRKLRNKAKSGNKQKNDDNIDSTQESPEAPQDKPPQEENRPTGNTSKPNSTKKKVS